MIKLKFKNGIIDIIGYNHSVVGWNQFRYKQAIVNILSDSLYSNDKSYKIEIENGKIPFETAHCEWGPQNYIVKGSSLEGFKLTGYIFWILNERIFARTCLKKNRIYSGKMKRYITKIQKDASKRLALLNFLTWINRSKNTEEIIEFVIREERKTILSFSMRKINLNIPGFEQFFESSEHCPSFFEIDNSLKAEWQICGKKFAFTK